MNEQMNLMDLFGNDGYDDKTTSIDVVKVDFIETVRTDWKELFSGYDELYAITFSSGLKFVDNVLEQFKYSEIIFGCEGVMNDNIATIMAMQLESVKQLIKSKTAKHMAEKLEDDSLKLYVSRDTRSHEKIFILKANDGRTRVITGSANMSASAFCGVQRENILCFNDELAFDYYMELYEAFREKCSDQVTHKAIVGSLDDSEFLQDHMEEIPIIKTVEKNAVFIEDTHSDEEDDLAEIVVNIKGHENEMKPMLPKDKKVMVKYLSHLM